MVFLFIFTKGTPSLSWALPEAVALHPAVNAGFARFLRIPSILEKTERIY